MEKIFLENFSIVLAGIASGVGGWFFGRKRAKADVDSVQIDNFDKGLAYYQKLVDDLGARLDKAISALHLSEQEKQEAIQKFTEATETIHVLERKVENLTDELKKYKQLNGKS